MSRLEALRAAFTRAGQVQVFDFWDELDSESRGRLLSQAAEIDTEEVSRLIGQHLKSDSSNKPDLDGLKPGNGKTKTPANRPHRTAGIERKTHAAPVAPTAPAHPG